jgi:SAM-dependent methyltransferase
MNAEYTDGAAAEAWSRAELLWGVWHRRESEIRALPDDLAGLDVVELGCGTAYVAAWFARHGAWVVGVDPTPAQLETARRLQRETGVEFELVEASAESVPLPDTCADLVVSEYGASIWADPNRWIPEAARLLRPGGGLVFVRGSTIAMVCAPEHGPVDTQLHKSYDEIVRIDWRDDEGGIEFHFPPGDLVRLLRESGFELERLIELRAPPDAVDHPYYDFVPVEWARRWPAEEIWVARKR